MEKLPKGAMRLVEVGDSCCAFVETDGKKPKFQMKAYSGGLIKGHWYWGDLAIDLQGMKFSVSKYPILEDHRTDKKIAFTGKPTVKDNVLSINPDTTHFLDTPESNEFQKTSQAGFPYQASIYAKPSAVERVMDGEKADVNGMSVKGPASIWRKCEFKEASVCVFGWDSETEASAFSRTETEEVDVEFIEKEVEKDDIFSINEDVKEVNSMDLEKLKKDHPELVSQLTEEVSAVLAEKFDTEKADLQSKLDQKNQENADQGDRILKLEKNEVIRTENEMKARAKSIWTQKLSASDVSEHLYDKVRNQISYTKFVAEGVLDVVKFGEAIDTEIKDWEDKGATTTVMGSGFSEKTIDSDAKSAEKMAEEDDATVKDLASLAGRDTE